MFETIQAIVVVLALFLGLGLTIYLALVNVVDYIAANILPHMFIRVQRQRKEDDNNVDM